MECEAARERYVEDLVAGQAASEEVARHLAGCPACREEVGALAGSWAALGALPVPDPSPEIARRLRRRVRRERLGEALRSLQAWQRAALAGVAGFAVSVALSLAVPYETMIRLCQALAPPSLPAPAAHLAAGILYGLLPMLVGSVVDTRGPRGVRLVETLEGVFVFLLVLVPYVLWRCGAFPVPSLAGFMGGVALGALVGGIAGIEWRARHAWAP
jgi:hypothetical protein